MFCCALLATLIVQPFVVAGSAADRVAAALDAFLNRLFPALAIRRTGEATILHRFLTSRWTGIVVVMEALLVMLVGFGFVADANAATGTQIPIWHICHALFGNP